MVFKLGISRLNHRRQDNTSTKRSCVLSLHSSINYLANQPTFIAKQQDLPVTNVTHNNPKRPRLAFRRNRARFICPMQLQSIPPTSRRSRPDTGGPHACSNMHAYRYRLQAHVYAGLWTGCVFVQIYLCTAQCHC